MFLFFHAGSHVSYQMSKSKTFPPSLKFLEFGVKITRKNLNRFRLPRDSEPSNLGSPIVSSRTRFVTQTNFFLGLPTTPCHKKNKKYCGSDTAKNVLIIGFLQCCNKKKQKKKNLGPSFYLWDFNFQQDAIFFLQLETF